MRRLSDSRRSCVAVTRSWLVHGTRSRSLRARPAGGLPHRYAARRTIREYGVAFGGRQSCCGQRSRGSCRAATRGAQRAPLQPLHAIPSWPWQIAARELVRRSEAGCVERPCAASRSPLVVGEAWDIAQTHGSATARTLVWESGRPGPMAPHEATCMRSATPVARCSFFLAPLDHANTAYWRVS